MKLLGRFILILTVALCAVSCFKNSGTSFSSTYVTSTSFEYPTVAFRADSVYFNTSEKDTVGGFGWDDLVFCHKLDAGRKEFQGGFLLSCLKGSGEGNDRFRVNSGAGIQKSKNYVVFYDNHDDSRMPKDDVIFFAKTYGSCQMLGCYVNNTKEGLNAVKTNFAEGDRLSIKVAGYLNGKRTGEQEFVLAEYTSQKDSLVTEWRPFDLGKLGMVDALDIKVVSTNPEVPTAFCMENMMAKIQVSF